MHRHNKDTLLATYSSHVPRFTRLVDNVKDALVLFLKEEKIPFLAVTGRVKEFESFFTKTENKEYDDPFKENEDFCGLRIIIYYPKDLQRLEEIINAEFNVLSKEDKEDKLNFNEFGYRSKHYIVTIKGQWASTPNYRNLQELKFEIQTRTILMHAWAEIEHKLGYKNANLVPLHLKRKLSRLSAKLEEADEQFQEIKTQIEHDVASIIEMSNKRGIFSDKELNVTTLTALLDYYFPNLDDHPTIQQNVLQLIGKNALKMQDIVDCAELLKPHLAILKSHLSAPATQSNLLAYALEIFGNGIKLNAMSESRKRIINIIRKEANLPVLKFEK